MREFLAIATTESGIPTQRVSASAACVARQLFVKRWNLDAAQALSVAIIDVVASGMGLSDEVSSRAVDRAALALRKVSCPTCGTAAEVAADRDSVFCERCQGVIWRRCDGWDEVDGVKLPAITWAVR